MSDSISYMSVLNWFGDRGIDADIQAFDEKETPDGVRVDLTFTMDGTIYGVSARADDLFESLDSLLLSG